MKLPPDPVELKSPTLPCGFSMTERFALRVKHYQACPHAYCRWRARAFRSMGRQLVNDMRRQQRRAVRS
jgi:hypothetical protein